MKLTEMIAKCREEAEKFRNRANHYDGRNEDYYEEYVEKSEEYKQIAGWLEELAKRQPIGSWVTSEDGSYKCSLCHEPALYTKDGRVYLSNCCPSCGHSICNAEAKLAKLAKRAEALEHGT